jgi:hypothetical protein
VWEFKNRYGKMALLLSEFVESFVEKYPDILNRQNDIYLNIDEM